MVPPGFKTLSFNRRVYAAVRRIPRGKVATYGQIAALIDAPRAARAVGGALALMSEGLASIIPWHRVVNASGAISPREWAGLQREMLEREGIRFSSGGRIAMVRYGWKAGAARMRAARAQDARWPSL